jgi:hypothetical protein
LKEDFDHNIPKRYQPNDVFLAWISPRFPVDRLSDKLVNDKVNKYSAYYWWGNLSFL